MSYGAVARSWQLHRRDTAALGGLGPAAGWPWRSVRRCSSGGEFTNIGHAVALVLAWPSARVRDAPALGRCPGTHSLVEAAGFYLLIAYGDPSHHDRRAGTSGAVVAQRVSPGPSSLTRTLRQTPRIQSDSAASGRAVQQFAGHQPLVDLGIGAVSPNIVDVAVEHRRVNPRSLETHRGQAICAALP